MAADVVPPRCLRTLRTGCYWSAWWSRSGRCPVFAYCSATQDPAATSAATGQSTTPAAATAASPPTTTSAPPCPWAYVARTLGAAARRAAHVPRWRRSCGASRFRSGHDLLTSTTLTRDDAVHRLRWFGIRASQPRADALFVRCIRRSYIARTRGEDQTVDSAAARRGRSAASSSLTTSSTTTATAAVTIDATKASMCKHLHRHACGSPGRGRP